jgi:hypothetical protein
MIRRVHAAIDSGGGYFEHFLVKCDFIKQKEFQQSLNWDRIL